MVSFVTARLRNCGPIPGGLKIFFVSSVPVLSPTKVDNQLVSGHLSLGVKSTIA